MSTTTAETNAEAQEPERRDDELPLTKLRDFSFAGVIDWVARNSTEHHREDAAERLRKLAVEHAVEQRPPEPN